MNVIKKSKSIVAALLVSLFLLAGCNTDKSDTAFSKSSTPDRIKVATWNIAWLGSHKFNKRLPKDYILLKSYAEKLDADVIALQEVENAEYAKKVFGDEFDYFFTQRNWVQRVGVAVRKSLHMSVVASEYKALDVGRVRYGLDITLSNGSDHLRLLAVHLKSGCFEKPIDSFSIDNMPTNSKSKKRKKNACDKLSKQVRPLENWIDERAKENIPFIVLGDFNRRFNKDVEFIYSESQGLWQAIDDEGSEDLWAPTLNASSQCWGGYYKDYIDHFVLDPRARNMFIKGSFEQLVFEGDYSRELSNALSDHCPISIELDF